MSDSLCEALFDVIFEFLEADGGSVGDDLLESLGHAVLDDIEFFLAVEGAASLKACTLKGDELPLRRHVQRRRRRREERRERRRTSA